MCSFRYDEANKFTEKTKNAAYACEIFYLLYLLIGVFVHVGLIIVQKNQDPMRGGRDDMFEDLVAMIHSGDPEALARDTTAPPKRRLVPEFMLRLARSVSPF